MALAPTVNRCNQQTAVWTSSSFIYSVGRRHNPPADEEVEMWQKTMLPVLPWPLLLLFLAYKQWDKHREIHSLVSRLRSSGAL